MVSTKLHKSGQGKKLFEVKEKAVNVFIKSVEKRSLKMSFFTFLIFWLQNGKDACEGRLDKKIL